MTLRGNVVSGRNAPTNNRPVPIRLPKVEQAVLHAMDASGVDAGHALPYQELHLMLIGRLYSGRWIERAVESLVDKELLAVEGTMLRRLDAG